VTFATVEEGSPKKNNQNKQDGPKKEKTKAQKAAERLAKMKCFNCGENGHMARNCPHKLKEEVESGESEPSMAGMTLACECYAMSTKRVHQWYGVCLDNGSQVNIVDPRLLTNLRTCSRTYRSMNGATATESVGHLDGFFDCQACTTCPANIISMADVEDLYPVTYVQGESITVHMEDREVVFHRTDKMYVADFLDWVVDNEDRVQELHSGLSLMTAADREQMYTRKEVCRSLEAGKFLRALGYPTEKEALNFVCDRNVTNVPFTVDEVNCFYDIYGPQVAGIRGRTTHKHTVSTVTEDSGSKMERTVQEVVADVMHVASEKFPVSVSSPLELLMTCHVKDLSKDSLGKGIQCHVSTLRSRSLEPTKFYVDPHKSLSALKRVFPRIEIDECGVGDHLDKVDTRIWRIKEIVRSIIAGLPYRLPRERLKDFITYAVSRISLKRTASLIDNVSPRVKFTGVRPGFDAEFGLAFGDYVKANNPRCQQESNNVMLVRTEPCITLYPSANRNGSWVLYNLNTKTYVRRTQWKKVPTSQLVINQMNELSGKGGISLADLEAIPILPAVEQAMVSHQATPDHSVASTAEEANIMDDVPMPDLVDQDYQDDESDTEDEVDDEDELEKEDELKDILQQDSDSSIDKMAKDLEEIAVQKVGNAMRRSKRTTAGVRRYDESYDWNLMNLSVNTALQDFGEVADKSCKDELK
jgi:hypothetical protein